MPHHLGQLLDGIESYADVPPFEFVEHHVAHAASSYYVSGFEESAILTLDGRGERVTTLAAYGQGANIARISEVEFPHSLGLLYEDVTSYLGFLRSSDEYKVMALASYGSDAYVDEFRKPGAHGGRRAVHGRPLDARTALWRGDAGASRWLSVTSISPTRCNTRWKRPCWSSRDGCTSKRGRATSAWRAALP